MAKTTTDPSCESMRNHFEEQIHSLHHQNSSKLASEQLVEVLQHQQSPFVGESAQNGTMTGYRHPALQIALLNNNSNTATHHRLNDDDELLLKSDSRFDNHRTAEVATFQNATIGIPEKMLEPSSVWNPIRNAGSGRKYPTRNLRGKNRTNLLSHSSQVKDYWTSKSTPFESPLAANKSTTSEESRFVSTRDSSSVDSYSTICIPERKKRTWDESNNSLQQRRVQPERKRRPPSRMNDSVPANPPSKDTDRAAVRKLSNHHSLRGQQHVAVESKVLDCHDDLSLLQCIVELPADATPGTRYVVQWPRVFPTDCPKSVVIECPRCVEEIPAGERRLIKVIAPGISFDPTCSITHKTIGFSSLFENGGRKKTRVRIGHQYQVDPHQFLTQENLEHNIDNESSCDKLEQLWDPRRAAEATRQGQDVELFVNENNLEFNEKMLRMEALHLAGYNVSQARHHIDQILHSDIPIALNKEEMAIANTSAAFLRKDFCKAASEIGRSTCACMVYYYNWKKSDHYQKIKKELSAVLEYCAICEDGGEMILCDQCQSAFHLTCLNPPLTKVPSEEWYCPQCCLKSPAKLCRIPSGPPQFCTLPVPPI